jgi:hypothetical protein
MAYSKDGYYLKPTSYFNQNYRHTDRELSEIDLERI